MPSTSPDICIYGSACSVMVIIRWGYDELSSEPGQGCLHFTQFWGN